MIEDIKREYQVVKEITKEENKYIWILSKNNEFFLLKGTPNKDNFTRKSLINEVNALIKLQKSGVVPILYKCQFNEQDNYFVCQFIKGLRLNKLQFTNEKQKYMVMLKVLQAVEKIHKCWVIHGDLKPENIIMTQDKHIFIIDYGISINDGKNYFEGYGSVPYCSYEQLTKQPLTYQTDIYSLGIIFYELMTGRFPFDGSKEEMKTKKKIGLFEDTDNNLLNAIYHKAINNDLKKRYQTISEFINDIVSLLKD